MARRYIAHLDMDAFYASVELLRYPELAGRPVVIGGRTRAPQRDADALGNWRFPTLREYTGRGVITTATYPARALGVHSGMGLMKAAQLAPDALLLPVDFDAYRAMSRRFKEAVLTVVPRFEDRGIDEIYIDLGEVDRLLGVSADGGRQAGERLRAAVREATGLTCSVAVAPNKLLAKIGSDLDKPDGLTILSMDDVPGRIWPLPARRINGIGPKAAERLTAMGIHTIGELAQAPVDRLVAHFGRSSGQWMHEAAHGRDARSLVYERDPKSISRETTFERDLHPVRDRAELGALLDDLCEKLAGDLERKGWAAGTVGIKLRFDDFRIVTRDETLPSPVWRAADLRRACGQCLKRVDLARRLRLMGVRTAALVPTGGTGLASRGPAPAAAETLPLFATDGEDPAGD